MPRGYSRDRFSPQQKENRQRLVACARSADLRLLQTLASVTVRAVPFLPSGFLLEREVVRTDSPPRRWVWLGGYTS